MKEERFHTNEVGTNITNVGERKVGVIIYFCQPFILLVAYSFLLGNGREYISCRLREIGNRKKMALIYELRKITFKMSRVCHQEKCLRTYDMHKNDLGKTDSGKQRISFLTKLCIWLKEQDVWKIPKMQNVAKGRKISRMLMAHILKGDNK